MAPQAIESQMQQKRTLEQRADIETKKNKTTSAAKPSASITAPTTNDCEANAISKNGKALAGAAKASFMKKCEGNARIDGSSCEAKAVSKDGKPLTGAAKAASIKKCEGDAKKS